MKPETGSVCTVSVTVHGCALPQYFGQNLCEGLQVIVEGLEAMAMQMQKGYENIWHLSLVRATSSSLRLSFAFVSLQFIRKAVCLFVITELQEVNESCCQGPHDPLWFVLISVSGVLWCSPTRQTSTGFESARIQMRHSQQFLFVSLMVDSHNPSST